MEKKNIIIPAAVVLVVVLVIGISLFGGKKSPEKSLSEMGGDISATTTVISAPGAAQTKSSVKTSTTPIQPKTDKNGVYLISYENSGFNPKTLSIELSRSVRFTNNSSKVMRIYSKDENYPYSSLNQSASVARGGTYEFNFSTKGLWEYYNLNNPNDKGSITVY